MKRSRFKLSFVAIITVIGVLAAIWSASLLVGGFIASGQLNSPHNPIGGLVTYIAASALIGATSIFYYVVGFRRSSSLVLMLASGGIVIAITILVSLTQLFVVVDAAHGDRLVAQAKAQLNGTAQSAVRLDSRLTEFYVAQIEHYRLRIEEERVTGEGPRFRRNETAYRTMRRRYGSALRARAIDPQIGKTAQATILDVADAVALLKPKVALAHKFADEAFIALPDYSEQLATLERQVAWLRENVDTDRRTAVYRHVIEMLDRAFDKDKPTDLGFLISALLSILPDCIQLLCTLLLLMLRAKAQRMDGAEDDAELGGSFRAFGKLIGGDDDNRMRRV